MQPARKIIFLDIDGVLNNSTTPVIGSYASYDSVDATQLASMLEQHNISIFNQLFTRLPDIQIVIHSRWIHLFPWDIIVEALWRAGISPKTIIGKTEHNDKAKAIESWVERFNLDSDKYVIFDDDQLYMQHMPAECIQVKPNTDKGITADDIDKAIAFFTE